MHARGHKKYITYQKRILSSENAQSRIDFAREREYWIKEDWRKVKFCDEVYYGQSSKRKLRIIRRSGERICPLCIQRNVKQEPKDLARWHCNVIVGYNFKSKIWFYETISGSGLMI